MKDQQSLGAALTKQGTAVFDLTTGAQSPTFVASGIGRFNIDDGEAGGEIAEEAEEVAVEGVKDLPTSSASPRALSSRELLLLFFNIKTSHLEEILAQIDLDSAWVARYAESHACCSAWREPDLICQ